jgi:hypothetical protein
MAEWGERRAEAVDADGTERPTADDIRRVAEIADEATRCRVVATDGGFAKPVTPGDPSESGNVAPTAFGAHHVAGETNIVPNEYVRDAIVASGTRTPLEMRCKLCIDIRGNVVIVELLKSSGYASYDAKVMWAMRAWKYQHRTDGAAAPACTVVTTKYSAW